MQLISAYTLLALWLGFHVWGLYSPALVPSMLGKREHCVYESFSYTLLPIMAAFILTKKLCPLKPLQCSFALILAAAMLPTLYMQIACMYEPQHIIKLHVVPSLITGLVVGLCFCHGI